MRVDYSNLTAVQLLAVAVDAYDKCGDWDMLAWMKACKGHLAELAATAAEDARPISEAPAMWACWFSYQNPALDKPMGYHEEPTQYAQRKPLYYAAAQPVALEPLTAEEINLIARPFIRSVGDHWSNELAIRDCDVEDFARAIEDRLRGNTPAIPLPAAAVAEGMERDELGKAS